MPKTVARSAAVSEISVKIGGGSRFFPHPPLQCALKKKILQLLGMSPGMLSRTPIVLVRERLTNVGITYESERYET